MRNETTKTERFLAILKREFIAFLDHLNPLRTSFALHPGRIRWCYFDRSAYKLKDEPLIPSGLTLILADPIDVLNLFARNPRSKSKSPDWHVMHGLTKYSYNGFEIVPPSLSATLDYGLDIKDGYQRTLLAVNHRIPEIPFLVDRKGMRWIRKLGLKFTLLG